MKTFIPLLQWLEQNKVVKACTTKQVNQLAENVKGLGSALKAGGIVK